MLLNETIHKFIQHIKSLDRSPQTIDGYSKDLKLFKGFLHDKYKDDIHMHQISDIDIEEYLLWLKEERNYASSSRSRNFYTLRSFFSFAYRKQIIDNDPTLILQNIKTHHKERVYLTDKEAITLINETNHPIIKIVAQTLYMTGLRISECLDLTLDTVDIENKIIHVIAGTTRISQS